MDRIHPDIARDDRATQREQRRWVSVTKGSDMASKKTGTGQSRSTGTKTTARRAAGRTAKAPAEATPEVNIRRAGPRSIALALYNRGPAFWGAVKNAVGEMEQKAAQTTQVEATR